MFCREQCHCHYFFHSVSILINDILPIFWLQKYILSENFYSVFGKICSVSSKNMTMNLVKDSHCINSQTVVQ